MSEIDIAVAIAVAVGAASLVVHKRSLTYIKLTVMIGCTGLMLITSLSDPEIRWLAGIMTVVSSVATYRLYIQFRAEQARHA